VPTASRSLVAGLHGYGETGVQHLKGTNAMARHSASPWVGSRQDPSSEAVHVSLVVLTGTRLDPDAATATIAGLEVTGRQVIVHCSNGEWLFV
jgi:hypothetical protein